MGKGCCFKRRNHCGAFWKDGMRNLKMEMASSIEGFEASSQYRRDLWTFFNELLPRI